MDPQQLNLPPPGNAQDFEDLCCALWEIEWNCADIQRHGRSGQKQYGVDIFGRPAGLQSYHGIQCKVKSSDGRSRPLLTRAEVDYEVEQAQQFRPPIEHLIIATTAPEDTQLQQYVRELSVQRAALDLFTVTVLSWPAVQARIAKHEAMLERFYPGMSRRLRHVDESLSGILRQVTFQPELLWEAGQAAHSEESLLSSLVYIARRDPLVGRKNDLAYLSSFLSDKRREFSWLLMVGPAGEGKTRLAFELVLQARRDGWHAGKLSRRDLSGLNTAEWRPARPTLMVLDYAAQQASEAHQLIATLSNSASSLGNYVRVLLLERNSEGPWRSTIVPKNSTGRTILEYNYISDEAIELGQITEDDVVELMRARFHRSGIVPPDGKALLEFARQVDTRSGPPRPLFAAAAAEALIAASSERAMDQPNKRGRTIAVLDREHVFDFLLERDREEFWLNRVALDQELERQRLEKHERLLLLSTFALGSVSHDHIRRHCPDAAREYLPSLDKTDLTFIDFRRLGRMGTAFDRGLPTVQPDVLGEHYILRQFETMAPEESRAMLAAALRLSGPMASEFIWRCAADFPQRAALIARLISELHDEAAHLAFANALVWITARSDDHSLTSITRTLTDSAKAISKRYSGNTRLQEVTALAIQNLVRKVNHDVAFQELAWLREIASVNSTTPGFRMIIAESTAILIERFAIQQKLDLVQQEVSWLRLFGRRFPDDPGLGEFVVRAALTSLTLIPHQHLAPTLSWLKELASDRLLSTEHMATLAEAVAQFAAYAAPELAAKEISWLIELSQSHPLLPAFRVEAASAVVVLLSKVRTTFSENAAYAWLKQLATDYSREEKIVTLAGAAALDCIARFGDPVATEELYWLKRLANDHPLNRDVRLHAATGAAYVIALLRPSEAESELAWLKTLLKRYPSDHELLGCAALGSVNLIRCAEPQRGAMELKWLRWLAQDLPGDPNVQFYAAAGTVHLISQLTIESVRAELSWLKRLCARHRSGSRVHVQSVIGAYYCMLKLASAHLLEEARVERDWIVEQSNIAQGSAELKQMAFVAQVQFFLDAGEPRKGLSVEDGQAAAEAAAALLPDCLDGQDDAMSASLKSILDYVQQRRKET